MDLVGVIEQAKIFCVHQSCAVVLEVVQHTYDGTILRERSGIEGLRTNVI